MSDDERATVPGNPLGEWALVGAKIIASFIPFGGPAAEVLGAIITPRVERRKTEWLENVARGLNELSKRVDGLTPERLAQDEAFTTAFLHVSQIAMRTHQREKLETLRNAVLNVAAGTAPDDNLQLIFLDALDTLTPWHVVLLDCIADPYNWADRHHHPLAPGNKPDASAMFETIFREQMPVKGFDAQLLQDLYNRGLVANNVNPRGQLIIRSEEDTVPHITNLGRQFLAFITTPEVDNSRDSSYRAS